MKIEKFKAEAKKLLNEKNVIVLEAYQSCPLKDICPFSDLGSKAPCFGTREDRELKFVCDIMALIKERENVEKKEKAEKLL